MNDFEQPHPFQEMLEEEDWKQLNYIITNNPEPGKFIEAVGNLNALCYCLGALGVAESIRPMMAVAAVDGFDEMLRSLKMQAAQLRMKTRGMNGR